MLVEEIIPDDCQQLTEVDEDIGKLKSDFSHSAVKRFSFFRNTKNTEPKAGNFIGCAIFKADYFKGLSRPRSHVYEALFPAHRKESENNFICCPQRYHFHNGLGDFTQQGVLYAQQNRLTFVCAHVALRAALSAMLPEGDVSYRTLNTLAGIDHLQNRIGKNGLELRQMETILDQLKIPFSKIVHEPNTPGGLILPTDIDYQRHLYGIIESGAPALLGFELTGANSRHIIPVFGHTFNEDAWVVEAQRNYFASTLAYYPSDSWLGLTPGSAA